MHGVGREIDIAQAQVQRQPPSQFNLGLVAEVAPTLAAGLEITRVQTQEVIRDWIIRMYTGEEPVSHGLAEQVLALDPKNEERSRLDGVRAPHLGEIV